jgi:hypothetical protein
MRDFLQFSALSFGWSIARTAEAGPADKDKGQCMVQDAGGEKKGQLTRG